MKSSAPALPAISSSITRSSAKTPLATDTVIPALPPASAIRGGASARARDTASSLTMVPCPEPSATLARPGALKVTAKVSSSSSTLSSASVTAMVFAVSPGAKVRVPAAAA